MNIKNPKKYEHLFFDLDDTVTRSRSPITIKMKERMQKLPQTIAIISGASVDQIRAQVGDDLECFCMGQTGNHTVFGDKTLWQDVLNPDKVIEIMDHVAKFKLPWDVPDENDLLENRGSQISFSIYGHHAPTDEKAAFDPDRKKREQLLKENPFDSEDVDVKIAGSTSFDYIRKGRHKGYQIERLIERMGWDKDTCLYLGDALFEGGNDYSVVGVIDTLPVKNHLDTYEKLKDFLL